MSAQYYVSSIHSCILDLLLLYCPKLSYLNEKSLNAFCILVLLLLLLVALLSMQNMMISICSHLLHSKELIESLHVEEIWDFSACILLKYLVSHNKSLHQTT